MRNFYVKFVTYDGKLVIKEKKGINRQYVIKDLETNENCKRVIWCYIIIDGAVPELIVREQEQI